MKLGLITDIHEHVEYLREALGLFRRYAVERVVVIGDVFEMGHQLEETCRLLAEAEAVGVWGNHDYGLCVNAEAEHWARLSLPPVVLDFMRTLRPRLEIEGAYFSHVEPWLDPEKLEHLWYFEGTPDEHGELDRIFNAVPHRLMFAGHYHKWFVVTPTEVLDWSGEWPIRLDQGRYFVVVGALCNGHCAVFDTETSELRPFTLK